MTHSNGEGGCCDGAAWTAPSGKLVAAGTCVLRAAGPAEEGSDPNHPMRNPRTIYGAQETPKDDGDEGESIAACNPSVWLFDAAQAAAADKLVSLGYRWEWSRSTDADGRQEGSWVLCEGQGPQPQPSSERDLRERLVSVSDEDAYCYADSKEQAKGIEELIGYTVWLPSVRGRQVLKGLIAERDRLRAELAAAIAERDTLKRERDEAQHRLHDYECGREAARE